MKWAITYWGSTCDPVHHRARFDVQAPHVRARGLPSAAVKIRTGLPSAAAFSRAPRMLVIQSISRQGLSPGCGRIASWRRLKSSAAISGTPGRAWVQAASRRTPASSLIIAPPNSDLLGNCRRPGNCDTSLGIPSAGGGVPRSLLTQALRAPVGRGGAHPEAQREGRAVALVDPLEPRLRQPARGLLERRA